MVNKLLVILCLCLGCAFAQYGDWNWNRRGHRHLLSPQGYSSLLLGPRGTLGRVPRPDTYAGLYDRYERPVAFPDYGQPVVPQNYPPANIQIAPETSGYESGSNVKFPANEEMTSADDPPQWPESGGAEDSNVKFPPTLPPLAPAGTEPQPVFTAAPPADDVTATGDVTPDAAGPTEPTAADELPALTPAPASESRNSFDPAAVQFSEPCVAETGGAGACVPLVACAPYLQLLQVARADPRTVQRLRQAHCGFYGNNPKVCCPVSSIPTQPPPTQPPPTQPPPTQPPTTEPAPAQVSDRLAAWPEPPVCGVSNATFTRVVGGVEAKIGDFPWMALLGYKKRGTTQWNCGGSLITSRHILTAAHCIHGHENALYVVRLGEHDLSRADEAAPVDVRVRRAVAHEAYNASTVANDIGYLELDTAVAFTDMIRPICLPTPSELRAKSFENYNPLIAGWGNLQYNGESANILQVVQLPVVGNPACREAFSKYKQLSIDERVLCAGFKQGGKDACQGDSGGPLMQPIWNKQTFKTYFYQIGVVSFGKKCAEPGFPGVYTRVTHFVPWLERHVLGA